MCVGLHDGLFVDGSFFVVIVYLWLIDDVVMVL